MITKVAFFQKQFDEVSETTSVHSLFETKNKTMNKIMLTLEP